MNKVLQVWCERLLLGAAGSPNVAMKQGISLWGNMEQLVPRGPGRDLHVVVRMNFAVAELPPHVLEQWPDMCVEIPPVDPGEGCKG